MLDSIINTTPLPWLFLGLIFLVIVTAQQLIYHYKLSIIPETAVVIVIGMILGLLTRLPAGLADHFNILEFDPEKFFLLLLPIIIFEGGYGLHKAFFFRNMFTIFSLAIVGTVINIAVTTALIFIPYSMWGSQTVDLIDIVTFSTVVSAVDPVATLSIFSALKVDADLNNLIFGESVLNDAAVVVLFQGFAKILRSGAGFGPFTPITLVFTFMWKTAISISLGVIMGFITTFYLRVTPIFMSRPWTEVLTLITLALIVYFVAEVFHVSGVMAILFDGVITSLYARRNMSEAGRHATHTTIELLSRMSESFIFLVLGAAVTGRTTGSLTHKIDWLFCFLVVLVAPIARFANVFPVLTVCNVARAITHRSFKRAIPIRQWIMIWYSGLRGAVCFALVLELSGLTVHAPMFMTATLVLAVLTVMVTGTGTLPMLKILRIPTGVEITEAKKDVARTRSRFHEWCHTFDAMVLRPLLTRDDNEIDAARPTFEEEIVANPMRMYPTVAADDEEGGNAV